MASRFRKLTASNAPSVVRVFVAALFCSVCLVFTVSALETDGHLRSRLTRSELVAAAPNTIGSAFTRKFPRNRLPRSVDGIPGDNLKGIHCTSAANCWAVGGSDGSD